MSRVEITLPEQFPFETGLDVYIGHINSGNHLANEALLSLLNEARVRFVAERRRLHPELAGIQWINADLAICYKSEVRHGERLTIAIAPTGFHRRGCNYVYRVTAADGRLVATAKTAMLVFDYAQRRLGEAPPGLPGWLGSLPPAS